MAKGLLYSMQRGQPVQQEILKVAIPVENLAVSVADGSPGWGTAVIGGLPQGNILLIGAVGYFQFTEADADVVNDWDGDFAVGTAPTADGSLAGGEVDIIPSTSTVQASGGVSSGNRGTHAAAVAGTVYDNTDGSLELNLNLLVDDADISGAATVTVNGVLHLLYSVLGDD